MPNLTEQTELNDPWESPPLLADQQAVATSQRLMALSFSGSNSYPEGERLSDEIDPIELQITQLQADKRRLLERNASLRAEVAKLLVVNQRLQQKLTQAQHPQPWWAQFFPSSWPHRDRHPNSS
jgi:hypothetical protein